MMRRDLAFRLRADAIALATGGRVLRKAGATTAQRAVVDSREVRPGDCFVALRGGQRDGHEFLAAAFDAGAVGAVVAHMPVTLTVPRGCFVVEVDDTGRALLALAASWRRAHPGVRVVGITGSCGKTSTKNMLGRALAACMPAVHSPRSFNNAVGVPLSLFQIAPGTRAAVVEIGSNAPGEIETLAAVAQPDVAIVTCIAESHLEGLGSLEGVAAEKAALLRALPPDGVAILNGDDPSTARHLLPAAPGRKLLVRVGQEADWFATDVRFHGLGTSFLLQGSRPVTIPLLGSHNVTNALFTIAAADALGADLDAVLAALAEMPATERRLQCREAGDVQVFDDTYNMNPTSARAALLAMSGLPCSGRRVVVFGEMRELGARSADLHAELGGEVARRQIDLLITVGEAAAAIAAGAEAAGMPRSRVLRTADQGEALECLLAVLRPKDRLLCKASHSIGFDRLVDSLLAALAARTAAAPRTDLAVIVPS
ncbi:MAG TPA: UDP-N-acetylmuramoyl-tripeptide--D-alanyl-D-alanine ligase [Planctomycetota bacterium]|nr:UDP-N-acetylmuramoyl-tripeptide--D-alanyl-D-alanine ligase [Planctomycetota bacterium]